MRMTKARRSRGSLGSRHIAAFVIGTFAWAALMYVISGSGDRRDGTRDTSAITDVRIDMPSTNRSIEHGHARVAVVLDEQPVIERALRSKHAEVLNEEIATRDGVDSEDWEDGRRSTLDEISAASSGDAAASRRPVIRHLKELGATVESQSSAPNAIIAVIPSASLKDARAIDGVASVERAPHREPLAASSTDGSPTWHTAGCSGAGAADASCAGATDSNDGHGGPDVAVIDHGVNLFHVSWGLRDPRVVSAPKRLVANGGTNPCAPAAPGLGYWCPYGSQHGNAVAAIIGSRDSSHLGMAYGVDKLIDPLGANSTDDWLLGFTNGGEPSAADLPEVVNDSSGVASNSSDPYSEKVADLYVSTFGILRTSAAGNSPSARVNSPCIAANTLCAGAISAGAAGRGDDAVASYTSPGPSANGRKKPDLLADGISDCPSDQNESTWIPNCGEGTSYASARLAAAGALLAGAGITNTSAQRALLINSSHMLPSAHDTVLSGSARYWTPDGAWGELALERAYEDRANVLTGNVTAAAGATNAPGPNSARFYRVDGLTAGDRVTLAWNRRINAPAWPLITGFSAHTLTDLDLFLYSSTGDTLDGIDADDDMACATTAPVSHCGSDSDERNETRGPIGVAADARDNVEQVRAAGLGSAIVKVKAASGIDGADAEPFGLAAEASITQLATPNLAFENVTLSQSSLRVGQTALLSADVVNKSSGADLSAGVMLRQLDTALDTPDGLSLIDIQTSSNAELHPGQAWHVEFTLQADQPGGYSIQATASGTRFGETFSSASESIALHVDNTPPVVQLNTPESWFASRTAIVSWTTEDQISGVEFVEVQSSVDGAPYASAYTGPDKTGSAHISASEGQTVRVRARATDAAGNRSAFSELHSWTVDAEEPQIDLQVPAKVAYGARAQVIVRAFNVGAPVTAYARYHASQPFTPVDEGLLIIPAVARQGKPVIVEAQALDALNRMVRRSATIKTVANKVGLSLNVVRKGKRKLLRVNMTRASTGTLVVSARCGRKRLGNRIDVERTVSALVAVRGATGTCSVTASLRPAATYQAASAKTSKRLRF